MVVGNVTSAQVAMEMGDGRGGGGAMTRVSGEHTGECQGAGCNGMLGRCVEATTVWYISVVGWNALCRRLIHGTS